jgi:hypothetical protein
MGRGRKPAISDAAAVSALADIQAYMRAYGLSANQLALAAGASPGAVLGAIGGDPPRWTPVFMKLHNFVNCKNKAPLELDPKLLTEQVRKLRGVDMVPASASATAVLLRAVADLLDCCEPKPVVNE